MEIKDDIRQLTHFQTGLFMLGGALMVIGMGSFVFLFHQSVASVVFLCGAVLFSVMQCLQSYVGTELTLRRLKSIQNMACLFLVLAGVLMVDTATFFLRPMFSSYETYIEVVYNKWLVMLAIAVVLEVYTTHRIGYEINKRQKKDE